MKFLEKDLEEIIWDVCRTGNTKPLLERGLDIKGHFRRQLYIGAYGIADIVSFKFGYWNYADELLFETEDIDPCNIPDYGRALEVTVFELKRNSVDAITFMQAVGYVKGIQKYLANRGTEGYKIFYKIVLIGATIEDTGNFIFIPDIFKGVSFLTYEYQFNGINFLKQKNYGLVEDRFKYKNKQI